MRVGGEGGKDMASKTAVESDEALAKRAGGMALSDVGRRRASAAVAATLR